VNGPGNQIGRVEVTYKAVTPMFCGGAQPSTAELRLPSFKGVLRWWWRALAFSRLGGNLERIAKEEEEMFGSARHGRGKVAMRLLESSSLRPIPKGEVLKPGSEVIGEGARYLGYGVMEAFDRRPREGRPGASAGQLTRGCLLAPFALKVELRVRSLDSDRLEMLLDALRALGVLGGLGAKSRKGYGSLVLQSLLLDGASRWSPPATLEDLQVAIRQLMERHGGAALPPYTALSDRTRVVLVGGDRKDSAPALLDRVGREMVRYRSWGHEGRVLGRPREGNFKADHDLMKQPPAQRTNHPVRIAFGLPHNYGSKPHEQVGAPGVDRRASPLLIHLHECGGAPVAAVSLFPARFLPGGDAAQIDVGGASVRIKPDPELWKPVHAFLDRLLTEPRERFSAAVEVRP